MSDLDRTITLTRQGGMWVATHSGRGSSTIFALFGTKTLPTAYLAHVAPRIVLPAIALLNRDAVVTIG